MVNKLYYEEKKRRTKAPNPIYEMEAELREWGRWKRNMVIGLGFKSSTIEYQIMKGMVFGTGCSGRGMQHDGVHIRDSEVGERIDLWIRMLSKRCPNECQVLKMSYVMQWSNRKIAKEGEISRSQTLKLKTRGITLLLGMSASQGH